MSASSAEEGEEENSMKSYAVLHAPEFRLQATLRHAPDLAGKPVALLETQGDTPRVCEMTAAARVFRVECGMTPTQALARCPGLHLQPGNAGHERSAQEALLQTAESFSPLLESTRPGVVTLELPGERQFHAEDFLQRIVVPLRALGLETQVGIAGTPYLALLAARFSAPVQVVANAASFLAPLPIAALQPGEEIAAILESWGIRTLGQFVALPAAEVWERLGPEAVQLREQALGAEARPLRLVKPRELFAEQADLEHPVEMLEPLLFLLRRFLEQITVRLGHAYFVAGKLRLRLRFDNGATYQRVFTIPQPTREVTLLFRMLHTHLENFTSESPIVALELAAQPVRPQTEQFGLFERGLRDPHQFAETLARLQALVSPGEVGTPELESSHHPDAFHLRPYDPEAAAPASDGGDLLKGVPWLRFRPPVPAHIILNEAGPAFLYSARSTGPIKDARGPWLLEGNWWEDQSWSREEWDIATEEGFYRLIYAGEKWFLDGIYA
jgi:protein ImuB